MIIFNLKSTINWNKIKFGILKYIYFDNIYMYIYVYVYIYIYVLIRFINYFT